MTIKELLNTEQPSRPFIDNLLKDGLGVIHLDTLNRDNGVNRFQGFFTIGGVITDQPPIAIIKEAMEYSVRNHKFPCGKEKLCWTLWFQSGTTVYECGCGQLQSSLDMRPSLHDFGYDESCCANCGDTLINNLHHEVYCKHFECTLVTNKQLSETIIEVLDDDDIAVLSAEHITDHILDVYITLGGKVEIREKVIGVINAVVNAKQLDVVAITNSILDEVKIYRKSKSQKV